MCVDLKTGQQVWYQNSTRSHSKAPPTSTRSCLLVNWLNYNEPNQFGVISYLWSTYTVNGQATWSMFDAFTGNWICNIVGVPSGTAAVDQNGNILRYQVNTAAGWIALWNTTQCLTVHLALQRDCKRLLGMETSAWVKRFQQLQQDTAGT